MEQVKKERRNSGVLTRRDLLTAGLLEMAALVLGPVGRLHAAVADDLDLISQIPRMADRDRPLLVFRDFISDWDGEIEHHIRQQLPLRKDLLAQIREKIKFDQRVQLSIEDIQVQLLFIPQSPKSHAAAYLRYCKEITRTIFRINRMENFYTAITSPEESRPDQSETGISAFLVHRLAKAFKATCMFTAESGRKTKYEIGGSFYSNHLGAVDLNIQTLAPRQYRLTRQAFTIWQNNTDNLYTLMAIPAEETLHYLVGAATDRELARAMQMRPPQSLAAARSMAEDWMAIEEAVVGGLVDQLLGIYCAQHHRSVPASEFTSRTARIRPLGQYRYRRRGLQLVADMGFQDAIALYMDDPVRFRDRL